VYDVYADEIVVPGPGFAIAAAVGGAIIDENYLQGEAIRSSGDDRRDSGMEPLPFIANGNNDTDDGPGGEKTVGGCVHATYSSGKQSRCAGLAALA
jgi:hypothetical protein